MLIARDRSRIADFHQHVHELVKRNGLASHASIYLDQYWALSNRMSRRVYESVEEFLRRRSIDINEPRGRLDTQIVIKPSGCDFYMTLNSLHEWRRALSMLEYLRAREKLAWSENGGDDAVRHVVFRFAHEAIFGQAVHNTASTLIVKLCGAGAFFANGVQQKVRDERILHYRNDYDFKLVKTNGIYVNSSAFVLWTDL